MSKWFLSTTDAEFSEGMPLEIRNIIPTIPSTDPDELIANKINALQQFIASEHLSEYLGEEEFIYAQNEAQQLLEQAIEARDLLKQGAIQDAFMINDNIAYGIANLRFRPVALAARQSMISSRRRAKSSRPNTSRDLADLKEKTLSLINEGSIKGKVDLYQQLAEHYGFHAKTMKKYLIDLDTKEPFLPAHFTSKKGNC